MAHWTDKFILFKVSSLKCTFLKVRLCSCYWYFWAPLSAQHLPTLSWTLSAASLTAEPWLQVLGLFHMLPPAALAREDIPVPKASYPTLSLVLVQDVQPAFCPWFLTNRWVAPSFLPSLRRSIWFEGIAIVFDVGWNCQEERQTVLVLFQGENKTEMEIKLFLYLGVNSVSISCNVIKVKNLQEKMPVVEMTSMTKKKKCWEHGWTKNLQVSLQLVYALCGLLRNHSLLRCYFF